MAQTISVEEYQEHVNDSDGFCRYCYEWTCGGIEPDAQRYECEGCGEKLVYGAEEAMMRGFVDVVSATVSATVEAHIVEVPRIRLDVIPSVVFESGLQLSCILSAVSLAMSNDLTREILSCLHIESDSVSKEVTFVATDGHRMHWYVMKEEASSGTWSVNVSAASVANIIREYKQSKGPVVLTFGEDQLSSSAAFRAITVDVNFPQWRQVICTKETDKPLVYIGVNAEYLADAQKAFKLINKSSQGVKMSFAGELDPIRVTNDSVPQLKVIIMPMRV